MLTLDGILGLALGSSLENNLKEAELMSTWLYMKLNTRFPNLLSFEYVD